MEEENYDLQADNDLRIRLRYLEEKQRILKDRTLLLGNNLIDLKENTQKDILEIKQNIEIMSRGLDRLKSFLETASNEFGKFARKEDLEILKKQAKMFQPLI